MATPAPWLVRGFTSMKHRLHFRVTFSKKGRQAAVVVNVRYLDVHTASVCTSLGLYVRCELSMVSLEDELDASLLLRWRPWGPSVLDRWLSVAP